MKGMRVKIHLTEGSIYPEKVVILRNVTEIHYRYPSSHERVAFESDIHGTGTTYDIEDVAEFEMFPEAEVADSF